jgi:hypothetical protein
MSRSRLRQILASEGLRIAASPLDASVKEAMKKGRFVGDPKIGSYTVAPEGIVVEVTVSVVVPPSKVLAVAPPKESLKLVFSKPELLSEIPESVLKTIPFKAMKPAQFTTFVKKMGGLGQYSDEVLRALLEGRSEPLFKEAPDDLLDVLDEHSNVEQYVSGSTWSRNHWGGGDGDLRLKIKGGVITGGIMIAIEWENKRGLTIKKDVDNAPYIDLDPALHGEGEKSSHPSLQGAAYLDGPLELSGLNTRIMAGRVEVLPKGTPGVVRVDVLREWVIGKTPLASLSRKTLEALVRWMAD